MNLTARDVAKILTVAASHDHRKIDPQEIASWQEAANLGRWSVSEAVEAVHFHYLANTERIKTAHVNEIIQQGRRDAVRRENDRRVLAGRPPLALARTDPASDLDGPQDATPGPGGLPLGRDVPGRRMSAALHQVHADACLVPCETCHAPAGEVSDDTRCRWPDGQLCRVPHLNRLRRGEAVIRARLAGEPPPQPARDVVSDEEARTVACPICRAPRGSHCTQRLDRTRAVPTHDARKTAAREALELAGQLGEDQPDGMLPVG